MLKPPSVGRESPKLDAAKELLQEELKNGPKLRNDIKEKAKEKDISWSTVREAKKALGVISEQRQKPRSTESTPEPEVLVGSAYTDHSKRIALFRLACKLNRHGGAFETLVDPGNLRTQEGRELHSIEEVAALFNAGGLRVRVKRDAA